MKPVKLLEHLEKSHLQGTTELERHTKPAVGTNPTQTKPNVHNKHEL